MQKTACYAVHQAAGGQMVEFAGWQLPLHYGSQLVEHMAVRQSAGLFDVSHMGLLDVFGSGAQSFLRRVLSQDVATMQPGQARYGCLLNPAAGMIDDVMVYALPGKAVVGTGSVASSTAPTYRLVLNAARCAVDMAWLQQQRAASGDVVQFKLRDDLALLALQGPESAQVLAQAFNNLAASAALRSRCGSMTELDAERLTQQAPMRCAQVGSLCVATTGYTGATGFEVMLPNQLAPDFWNSCVQAGAQACGLGARDSLRTEAGLNLYGSDMDDSTLPQQVRLSWTVDLTDPARDFIGRAAYESSLPVAAAPHSAQVGVLALQPGVMRAGHELCLGDASAYDKAPLALTSRITSGCFSPLLQCSIGLAQVPLCVAQHIIKQPQPAQVKLSARRQLAVQLLPLPFIKRGKIQTQVREFLKIQGE